MKVEMKVVKVSYPPFFREPLEFPPSILSDNVSLERVALLALNRAAIYSDLRDGARLIDGRWNGKVIPLGGTLAIYRSPEYRYFVRLPVDGPLEPWPAQTIMLPIAIYLGAELPSQTDQAAIDAVSATLEQAVDYIYDPQGPWWLRKTVYGSAGRSTTALSISAKSGYTRTRLWAAL